MENPKNPFYFRGPLNPDDSNCPPTMVWRDDLLEKLLGDVENIQYPLILGPRQTGKTTLAHQLASRLGKRENYIVCFIECGILGGAKEENVVELLYSKLTAELEKRLLNSGNDVLLGYLKNRENTKPQTFYEFSEFLEDIQSKSIRIKRIVLILDEVEVIQQQILFSLLSMFRMLYNLYHDIYEEPCYCVIMIAMRNLAALDLGSGSPYNIAETREVRNLSREQVEEMLSPNHAGIPEVFTKEAIEILVRETGGHPYLVQRICGVAFTNYINEKSLEIDKKDIIESILHLFEHSDRNLRIVLDKVEENESNRTRCKELLRGARIPFERVIPDLNRLYEAGIVHRDTEHGRILCVFSNRIYERLFLNRYFDEDIRINGKYLLRDATLFVRSSEIQRILYDEEIRKTLEDELGNSRRKNREDKLKLLKQCLQKLLKNGRLRYDIDMIKHGLFFFGTGISEKDFTNENIIEVLARLYLEMFTLNI